MAYLLDTNVWVVVCEVAISRFRVKSANGLIRKLSFYAPW